MQYPAKTSDQIRPLMDEMSKTVDRVLNGNDGTRRWGFILVIAEIGKDDGTMEIARNITDETAVATLKEMLARYEGRLIAHAGKA